MRQADPREASGSESGGRQPVLSRGGATMKGGGWGSVCAPGRLSGSVCPGAPSICQSLLWPLFLSSPSQPLVSLLRPLYSLSPPPLPPSLFPTSSSASSALFQSFLLFWSCLLASSFSTFQKNLPKPFTPDGLLEGPHAKNSKTAPVGPEHFVPIGVFLLGEGYANFSNGLSDTATPWRPMAS